MTFQSQLNTFQAAGVVGEFAFEGPRRVQTKILDSGDAADNVVGRAFSYSDATGENVQAGGDTLPFAGILIAPKSYASGGTAAGGSLAPTLTLRNAEIGEFCLMGEIFVSLPAAANIGDLVYSLDADGTLLTAAPGASAPANSTLIPNCTVSRYDVNGSGAQLAVIKLTN